MEGVDLYTGSEEDVKGMYITPAINNKGWQHGPSYCMEYAFTEGRVFVSGNFSTRGKKKSADYYLYDGAKSRPLTIIEAKKASKDLSVGIQQAIDYAKILDLSIAYASNGKMFREYDLLTGKQRDFPLSDFPTMDELKARIRAEKGYTQAQQAVVDQPYYYSQNSHEPRYYQRIAIDRTIEAIAKGDKRILLVMATGTGKTFTAFQILWRLRASGYLKNNRILYIADRNILIDQTMNQDFKPFKTVMTKVTNKTMDSSFEIHMALYQQLVSYKENVPDTFTQFSKDFFDLVVVDECHRGSAKENSEWRRVLTYFSSAIHLGLTATPKQAAEANNFDYFGEPIYTYSLKQGIEDGFLAPYKVTKCYINVDKTGYTPNTRDIISLGSEEIKDYYTRHDFGREITLLNRQRIVAKRITEKLKEIGRMKKTIVFCPDIEEAGTMRDLLVEINQDMMSKDPRYIMRITSEDYENKKQLDNFIDPDSPYPVVVTTSELLSTGVDCKTCALIVIDKEVSSMTMFKQMIGRGTRLYEDKNKYFFDILDFRGVTELFSDPDFDGEGCLVDPPFGPDTPKPKGGKGPTGGGGPGGNPPIPHKKTIFKGRRIRLEGERLLVLDMDGKELETTNVIDFTRKHIRQKYTSLHDFISTWSATDRHKVIMDELAEYAVLIDAVRDARPELRDLDIFDIICHVAYEQKPLTRKERANNVKKRNYFAKYEGKAREVLEALLDKYADQGILNLEDPQMLRLDPFSKIGTPMKIISLFGGRDGYQKAIHELEQQLYTA